MFYTYRQNNSGGSFDYDEKRGISVYVIVEADNAKQANSRAEDIGIYFNGIEEEIDCECCGSRWDSVYEEDGKERPSVYSDTDLNNRETYGGILWTKGYEAFVHSKDGKVKGYMMGKD